MDLFFEQIVKKKRTGLDFLRVFACIFLGLIVVMALFLFSGLPGLGFIIFVVCCIIIYFLYMLITATNLEYEYTFTNGDLDVDKIINVRSRKKLIQLNAREIEVMGSAKNSRHEFEKYLNDKEKGLCL
ncbi:MAG: DUF6106 family protein [Oscillospiraceae bacterium]